MDSMTIGTVIVFIYLITVVALLVRRGFKSWEKELDNESRRITLKENKAKK